MIKVDKAKIPGIAKRINFILLVASLLVFAFFPIGCIYFYYNGIDAGFLAEDIIYGSDAVGWFFMCYVTVGICFEYLPILLISDTVFIVSKIVMKCKRVKHNDSN